MSWQILINRFLNGQRRAGKSVLTLSAYATDLKQFLSFLAVSSPKALPSDERLKAICLNWSLGLKPNTAARKLTTLRLFLSWAHQSGYIKKDLTGRVGRPDRQTIAETKPLSASQISRLRRNAGLPERLLLELILQTGMRLTDAVNLKMKHLRMANQLQNSFIRHPNSNIPIPISPYLQQALEYYLAAMTRGQRSFLLVSSKTGRNFTPRTAAMMLSKLGKKAGVRGVTPRNLRASFIVKQLEAGVAIGLVSEIVGHETVATTQKYLQFVSGRHKKIKASGSRGVYLRRSATSVQV